MLQPFLRLDDAGCAAHKHVRAAPAQPMEIAALILDSLVVVVLGDAEVQHNVCGSIQYGENRGDKKRTVIDEVLTLLLEIRSGVRRGALGSGAL